MKRPKPYVKMNVSELEAATRQFDEPFVADKSRALTAQERKLWQRARRKRGRPKSGEGYCRISVSIEGGLLKKVTALAKRRRVSRSKLLAEVLTETIERGD